MDSITVIWHNVKCKPYVFSNTLLHYLKVSLFYGYPVISNRYQEIRILLAVYLFY